MIQDIFTTGQVAKICRVSSGTVANWADRKILPCYRLPRGRDRRFNRDDVRAFLDLNGMPTDVLDQMDHDREVEHATA